MRAYRGVGPGPLGAGEQARKASRERATAASSQRENQPLEFVGVAIQVRLVNKHHTGVEWHIKNRVVTDEEHLGRAVIIGDGMHVSQTIHVAFEPLAASFNSVKKVPQPCRTQYKVSVRMRPEGEQGMATASMLESGQGLDEAGTHVEDDLTMASFRPGDVTKAAKGMVEVPNNKM